MQIKHKKTPDEFHVSYSTWKKEYLDTGKYVNYDIIKPMGVAELHVINEKTGELKFNSLMDASAAKKLYLKNPKKYFIQGLKFKDYSKELILISTHNTEEPKSPKKEKGIEANDEEVSKDAGDDFKKKEEVKVESNPSNMIIDRLKIQLERVQNLKFGDPDTRNDIIKKLKMYMEHMFPNKTTLYAVQLENIIFHPTSTPGNRIKAWTNGKKELINFIEEKIDEYEINQAQKRKGTKEPNENNFAKLIPAPSLKEMDKIKDAPKVKVGEGQILPAKIVRKGDLEPKEEAVTKKEHEREIKELKDKHEEEIKDSKKQILKNWFWSIGLFVIILIFVIRFTFERGKESVISATDTDKLNLTIEHQKEVKILEETIEEYKNEKRLEKLRMDRFTVEYHQMKDSIKKLNAK